MNTHRIQKRLLPLLLSLLIFLGATPPAVASGSFEAVVAAESMAVYAREAPHDYLGALPRGTQVTVLAYSGSAALIQYKGYTGIARVTDMTVASYGEEEGEDETEPTVETTTNKPVVAARDTRVYQRPSASSRYVAVKAGTQMNLLGVNGSCAKVERGGAVGYAVFSHLAEPGDVETPEEPAPTEPETPEVTVYNIAAVTTQSARIYQKASTSSRYVTVDKGFKVTLVAVSGSCAKVSRGSAVGYMDVASLKPDDGSEETPTEEPTKRKPSNPFASGSNEAVIYSFLVGEGGFNRAAAMGIMANIRYESGYRPTCEGDRGTSYGICQWHLGRKTNLINWCTENGYDYKTLEGQLRFLKYELSTRYPSVHSYLKRVEDSAEGAYDAAYYFCFNFEAPAARTSQSTARGKYARDTLYNL